MDIDLHHLISCNISSVLHGKRENKFPINTHHRALQGKIIPSKTGVTQPMAEGEVGPKLFLTGKSPCLLCKIIGIGHGSCCLGEGERTFSSGIVQTQQGTSNRFPSTLSRQPGCQDGTSFLHCFLDGIGPSAYKNHHHRFSRGEHAVEQLFLNSRQFQACGIRPLSYCSVLEKTGKIAYHQNC